MMKKFPSITRGNVALFKAVTRDASGNPTTPDSVTAFIEYESLEGGRLNTTATMTLSSGVWTAAWDSSGEDVGAGDVAVSLRAVNPSSAADFTFLLTANEANPANPV